MDGAASTAVAQMVQPTNTNLTFDDYVTRHLCHTSQLYHKDTEPVGFGKIRLKRSEDLEQ